MHPSALRPRRRSALPIASVAVLASLALTAPPVAAADLHTAAPPSTLAASASTSATSATGEHRVITYYQTHYRSDGSFVSLRPLIDEGTDVSHVIVGALHLNEGNNVTLNDHAPDDPFFDPVWKDVQYVREHGVTTLAMIGGAAPGTWERLDTDFDTYYPQLRDFLRAYDFQGADLDVEQETSQAGVIRVIEALKHDFGEDFLVTLTPVSPETWGGHGLSGLDLLSLKETNGDDIDWLNVQGYCGWGDVTTTNDVYWAVDYGGWAPSKIVYGVVTDPGLCGGYAEPDVQAATIRQAVAEYPDLGGVFGWEYYTSQPGGEAAPWEWAALMREAIGAYVPPSDRHAVGAVPDTVRRAQADGSAQVLVGDWNGDGLATYALRQGARLTTWDVNGATADPATSVVLGHGGYEVLVGDWDGDGTDTVALRQKGKIYYQVSTGSSETTRGAADKRAELEVVERDGRDVVVARD